VFIEFLGSKSSHPSRAVVYGETYRIDVCGPAASRLVRQGRLEAGHFVKELGHAFFNEELRKQVFLEGRDRGRLGVKDQWVTPVAEGGFLERAR